MRRHLSCLSCFVLVSTLSVIAGCSSAADASDDADTAEGELSGLAPTDVVLTVQYGDTTAVASSATRRYRAVQFTGAAGDVVDVWVRSSADARAWLIGTDFKKTVASNDDDSSATRDAHVQATLPTSGTYTIVFREKHASPTTFSVSLAGGKAQPTQPTHPTSATDPCVKHPWPTQYGCRDHQGRSTAVGPTAPILAWQVEIPVKARVDKLLADADGTVYAVQDSVLTAVTADGKVAWHTGAFGRISDIAIGGDDALYVYEQGTIGKVSHTLARFSPTDGKRTQIFSEAVGSTALPRIVTPLADGRIHFGVGKERAATWASEGVVPSSKIYDPATKTLTDAPMRPSFHRGADLPGGGFLTADYADLMQGGAASTDWWIDRHAASGAIVAHSDHVSLWGVGPGGTVFGVRPDPSDRWGSFGSPSVVRADGSVNVLTTSHAGTIPFTFAITPDDAVVYGGYPDHHAPSAAPPNVVGKYTKTGTKVFEKEVRLEGGNIAVDANGNIYAGGQGFAPDGTSLFAGYSLGYYLPENHTIALGGNRTLYTTWGLLPSDGTIYALRDK